MVLLLQLKLVRVELCSLGDDTPSSIVSEHGRLPMKIHGPVHFSHCDVKINLCVKGEGERERGGRERREKERREKERGMLDFTISTYTYM